MSDCDGVDTLVIFIKSLLKKKKKNNNNLKLFHGQ